MTEAREPAGTDDAPCVLIVDDYPDGADTLAEAVELFGYRTAVAHDARRALELAAQCSPRVALVDIGLPDISGYELGLQLQARCGADITLIAVTGFGGATHERQAAEAGFKHYLLKPVELEHLKRLLRTIVAPHP